MKPITLQFRTAALRTVAFLVFSCSYSAYAQFTVIWDDPIAVHEGDFDNNKPKVALNADNQPVVIWGKNNGKLLYSSVLAGSEFSEPTQLTPDGFEIFTSDWAGPEVGSNGDNVFAVFHRYPENVYGNYLVRSMDGGQTWSDTVKIDNIQNGDMQSRFPNVVVDENGNPAVTIMTFTGNYLDPEYEVLTSTDQGESFGPLVNSSTDFFGGEACDCCTAELVYDGNRLIQLYRNNASNLREIKAVSSSDWGQTFNETYSVDNTDTWFNACFSSGPDGFIADNILYTAARAQLDQGARIFVSDTDLEGSAQISELLVDPDVANTVVQSNARMAGNQNYIGLVWQQSTSINDDVIFSFSFDGVGSLANNKDTVNVTISGKQKNPDIAFVNDVFHVVWQDSFTNNVVYRRGTVQVSDGISKVEPLSVSIFPNPASDVLTLTADQPAPTI